MKYILQIVKKTGKRMHKRNSEHVLTTTVAAEKQTVLHITRVFVALVIQQANRIFSAPHYSDTSANEDNSFRNHIR